MEFQGALFHNISELTFDPEYGDYQMDRVPREVRYRLNQKARENIRFMSNSEIRFVMEGEEAVLSLRRAPVRRPVLEYGAAQVFQGEFQGSYEIGLWPVGVEGNEIRIRRQDWKHIQNFRGNGNFAPEVTRILLPYDWGCCIGGIKGKIRTPEEKQLPEKRLLVYGSSITHGGNASLPSHTFAFQLAQRLGMDLINLGCAGSAWMDPAMSCYIGSRDDWDMALLELGVNVLELWDCNRLYQAVWDFLYQIKKMKPDQPVFVTDIFYNHHDYNRNPQITGFRQEIRKCVEKLSSLFEGLLYVNGIEALGSWTGLSSDGLHPSDMGHHHIAEELARFIERKTKR